MSEGAPHTLASIYRADLTQPLRFSAVLPCVPTPSIPRIPTAFCLPHVALRTQICRSGMFLVDQTKTSKQIDTLEDTRDVIDQSTLEPEPFGFHSVSASTKRVRGVCGGGGRYCGEWHRFTRPKYSFPTRLRAPLSRSGDMSCRVESGGTVWRKCQLRLISPFCGHPLPRVALNVAYI